MLPFARTSCEASRLAPLSSWWGRFLFRGMLSGVTNADPEGGTLRTETEDPTPAEPDTGDGDTDDNGEDETDGDADAS